MDILYNMTVLQSRCKFYVMGRVFMKHSLKRILALALTLLLVITMFPTVAFAGTTKNEARIDNRVND